MIDVNKVFNELTPIRTIKGEAPLSVLWTIPVDLPYFDGHFPGNPIFPAVGILDATVYLLGTFAKSVVTAKFLNLIGPRQTVRIELQSVGEQEWQVDWKDHQSAKILATLRVRI